MLSNSPRRFAAAISASAVALASLYAAAPAAVATEVAPATKTTTISGYVTALSSESHGADSDVQMLHVRGKGYLLVDYSKVNVSSAALGRTTVTIEIPEGTDLGDTTSEKFDALLSINAEESLEAVALTPATAEQQLSAMVNVSYAATATHKIYAVPVTPAGDGRTAIDPSQGDESIASVVAYASDYWSQQSSGKVKFALQGTADWYKSGIPCVESEVEGEENLNAFALFNEAYTAAVSELDFEDAQNAHIVLVFPEGTDCGNTLGKGTVGATINEGGILWAIGTDSPESRHTFAHELGHNLSLGHANWVACPDAKPTLFGGDCVDFGYGDGTDVMGISPDEDSAGALSSAHAIRSGLWSSTAFSIAPRGTTSHTLNSVSSNSGKRAVVVQGDSGIDYFVEYRNFTGEDAQFSNANLCDDDLDGAGICIAPSRGVRVMRLGFQPQADEFGDEFAYKGFFGDDSYVIGRTINGQPRINYLKGESISIDGLKISVADVTSSTAKVTVVKSSSTPWYDYVDAMPTQAYDWNEEGGYDTHAGDVWTAFLRWGWGYDSVRFQWQRNGANISGATRQNYVLKGEDIGKTIRVKVTGKQTGYYDTVFYEYVDGPIIAGVMDQGEVAIDQSATPLKAKLSGWATAGSTYSYQWYRVIGSTDYAISGATAATYTPTTADTNRLIRVKVTARKSGFNTLSATSEGIGVTLAFISSPTIDSFGPRVGETITVTPPFPSYDLNYSRTYQWKRDGVAIPGATSASYKVTSADLGSPLSVRVVTRAPGFIPAIASAGVDEKVTAGSFGDPAVSIEPKSTGLVATVSGTSVKPTTITYQWYRGDAKITGATAATYKQTSADRNKYISVRAVLKRSGYETKTLSLMPTVYTIIADAKPTISSANPGVGGTVSAVLPVYSATPTLVEYAWFADGVFTGIRTSSFTPADAHIGKALTVRVTATAPGYLGSIETSLPTQDVVDALG